MISLRHFFVSIPPTQKKRALIALLASAVAAVFSLGICSPLMANTILRESGYWGVLGLTVVAIWALVRGRFHRDVGFWLLNNKRVVLVSFFLALSLHTRNIHEYRILYDEYVLGSTAAGMHIRSVPSSDYLIEGSHGLNQRVASRIDKRPLFFPFLVSLTHEVFGARMGNVYALNGLLTWALFLLVFRMGSLYSGVLGYSMMGLMAGFPLIDMVASSAGYDLLNVFLIGVLFLLSLQYVEKRDAVSMDAMVVSALLLSNCRYESIAYVLVPFLIVLISSIRTGCFELTRFVSISPLFLILPLMSNRVFYGDESFFQTDPSEFFGWSHFVKNAQHAGEYLFSMSGYPPNSVLLSVVGLGSVLGLTVFVLKRLLARKAVNDVMIVYCVLLMVVLLNTALALSVFWGNWTDIITTRFSIPFQFVLFIAVSIFVGLSFSGYKHVNVAFLYLVYLYYIGVGLWVSCMQYQVNGMPASFGYNWIHSRENRHLMSDDVLVLSEGLTGLFIGGIRGDGVIEYSIEPDLFDKAFESGKHSMILIADYVASSPLGGTPYPTFGHVISPDVVLDVLSKRKMTFDLDFVIGKTVGVKMRVPDPFVPKVNGVPVSPEGSVGSISDQK